MTPYYEDASSTIYCGDCREVLRSLQRADLVLTDPPYGTVDGWQGGGHAHGWRHHNVDERREWDVMPTPDELAAVVAKGTHAVVWGGNHFELPPSRGWLVWNKRERGFSLAEAELAWTNRDALIRVFDFDRNGRDHKGLYLKPAHPTQKPVELMRWCLTQFPDAQTILDPYMGSGTTLRAARDMGRQAIGIELSERYCEIAAKRLAQEVLAL